jgi:hypothetical protein
VELRFKKSGGSADIAQNSVNQIQRTRRLFLNFQFLKNRVLKLRLNEAHHLKSHKDELARMEAELALVENELRGSLKTTASNVDAEVPIQPKPSGAIAVDCSDEPPNTVDDKVRMVLKKSHRGLSIQTLY